MVKFKQIRVKMRGGKSRLQRVQVLASGKYKFVKNLTKSKSRPRARHNPKRKTVRRMARRKRRRSKRSFTIPLAPTLAIAGQFVRAGESGWSVVDHLMAGNINGAISDARGIFTGIKNDGSFDPMMLIATYGPIVAAALIHKFVGGAPLNINRMLAQAGVPIIRI